MTENLKKLQNFLRHKAENEIDLAAGQALAHRLTLTGGPSHANVPGLACSCSATCAILEATRLPLSPFVLLPPRHSPLPATNQSNQPARGGPLPRRRRAGRRSEVGAERAPHLPFHRREVLPRNSPAPSFPCAASRIFFRERFRPRRAQGFPLASDPRCAARTHGSISLDLGVLARNFRLIGSLVRFLLQSDLFSWPGLVA